jgi:hypothetical protein
MRQILGVSWGNCSVGFNFMYLLVVDIDREYVVEDVKNNAHTGFITHLKMIFGALIGRFEFSDD